MPNTAYAYDDDDDQTTALQNAKTAAERERLALLKEVQEAEEDYERTGLHVTWEEMEAWLETWGTDHEIDPPEPHT